MINVSSKRNSSLRTMSLYSLIRRKKGILEKKTFENGAGCLFTRFLGEEKESWKTANYQRQNNDLILVEFRTFIEY